ncbi:hypothetical protein EJ05DRAFT_182104 [Pseudovirgaria hyperparasitica]|uniref:Uncharacterized protein n=1 Tax=Pseudovirgaria hyperparasitica TaxID=470096 RepID=A0A6A6WJT8_9PEZI|nr:uncharacterized protein EJ05DRAFT_182104 [Pseudovirgaria hyperparasitica]KAF2761691.1 hypothetical protein EJ05DRAFT_182104 [Pseudovirgaria hyperparasitica]
MKGFEPLYQTTATQPFNPFSLLPGLLTLAPLSNIAHRTAIQGVSPLDALILAPGLHLQQTATELHKAEYPACAALTTGYVFRVENPATVFFLQRIGRTGHLIDLDVSATSPSRTLPASRNAIASLAYYAAAGVTTYSAYRLYALKDPWAMVFLSNLILTRVVNFVSLRRRSELGWFGAPEPGVRSDILVLLSQDRWIRIRGATDDVKGLLSGTWLREPTTGEKFFGAVTKLLAYANVAVAGYATTAGVATLMSMLLVNGGLLALDGLRDWPLCMYGRTMGQVGEAKRYFRRRDLAEELIKETGRDDWAVGMGMIVKKNETVLVTM